MRVVNLTFLLLFAIGISACMKSQACVKNTKTNIEDLDESQMTYNQHSHNGATIKIPAYITPNNDALNDHLALSFNDTLCFNLSTWVISPYEFELVIENKCGQMFYSTDACAVWDGTFNGATAKKGIYNYTVQVEWNDGVKESLGGVIELVY